MWYPANGVLPKTSYSYEAEPSLRLYSDFRMPRRMIEGVVREMKMGKGEDAEVRAIEDRDEHVKQKREVIGHTMKKGLAAKIVLERVERLEEERAKQAIRSGYALCTDARIKSLTFNKPTLQISYTPFHFPIYCSQYSQEPPMFKIVNGFTG